MTPFPETLKSQAVLALCVLFVLSHLFSLFIYEANRSQAIYLTEATDLAERIVGIVQLSQDFPDQERQRILNAAQTQFLMMYPAIKFPDGIRCENNEFAERMSEVLEAYFRRVPGLEAGVCVRSLEDYTLLKSRTQASGFDVLATITFPDGSSTVFHAVLPEGPSLLGDSAFWFIVAVSVISLLVAWYVIVRIVSPLERFADAADQIGMNIDSPALEEAGPGEVRQAARALNRMQGRLQRLVRGQTETIAAISHDLRTAITRLQLKAELLKDEGERVAFLRVVEDMRVMVQSVLDFIKGIDPGEQPRVINLAAMLESLCVDLSEEGYPVRFAADDHDERIRCRPTFLKRSFLNVIDNAIKYGNTAKVSLSGGEETVKVTVDDEGPGVPEDEIEKIVRPFYRMEQSRNLDTGGVGLGLSIAQGVIHSHGGKLELFNKTRGLRVEITLPRSL